MIGSEESIADAADNDGALLLYDYFKHLTTLSLVALGGVLSLSQAGVVVEQRQMVLIASLIGGGGVLAFTGLDTIVKARAAGRSVPRWTGWLRACSVLLFGLGIGAFARAFLDGIA